MEVCSTGIEPAQQLTPLTKPLKSDFVDCSPPTKNTYPTIVLGFWSFLSGGSIYCRRIPLFSLGAHLKETTEVAVVASRQLFSLGNRDVVGGRRACEVLVFVDDRHHHHHYHQTATLFVNRLSFSILLLLLEGLVYHHHYTMSE